MLTYCRRALAWMRVFWFRILVALSLLVAVWSLFIEPARLVRRPLAYTWHSASLRVVFFSDLHQGAPHIDADYVARLVARINDEKPDLVLIGGDLLINGVKFGHRVGIEIVARELGLLQARLGTHVVLGNHDWWNDGRHVRDALTAAGIRVLDNEAIQLGNPAARFNLVGVGDDLTGHARTRLAFTTVDQALPTLVFMHDASALLDAPDVRFDVAMAGHTHGGQVYLPFVGALVQPGRAPLAWAYGDTALAQGRLRTTGGIGTSIFPIRFNMPPEYLVIDFSSLHEP